MLVIGSVTGHWVCSVVGFMEGPVVLDVHLLILPDGEMHTLYGMAVIVHSKAFDFFRAGG